MHSRQAACLLGYRFWLGFGSLGEVDGGEKGANQKDQEINLHFCTLVAAPLQPAYLLQCKVRSSFLSRSGEEPEKFKEIPSPQTFRRNSGTKDVLNDCRMRSGLVMPVTE